MAFTRVSLVTLVENETIRGVIGDCDFCLIVALSCTCDTIRSVARLETSSFISGILQLPLSPTDSEVLADLAIEHEIYSNEEDAEDESYRCYWELVHHLDSQDDCWGL